MDYDCIETLIKLKKLSEDENELMLKYVELSKNPFMQQYRRKLESKIHDEKEYLRWIEAVYNSTHKMCLGW